MRCPMKLDAHPMVVAVALGLLGPGALIEEDDEATCASCADAAEPSASWEPGPAPDPEEFHRVALAWESLSNPSRNLKV
jgi:hypothetical protein